MLSRLKMRLTFLKKTKSNFLKCLALIIICPNFLIFANAENNKIRYNPWLADYTSFELKELLSQGYSRMPLNKRSITHKLNPEDVYFPVKTTNIFLAF